MMMRHYWISWLFYMYDYSVISYYIPSFILIFFLRRIVVFLHGVFQMSSLGSICYFIHRAARAITRKSLSSDMKNLQKWLNAFLKRKKLFFFSLSLSLSSIQFNFFYKKKVNTCPCLTAARDSIELDQKNLKKVLKQNKKLIECWKLSSEHLRRKQKKKTVHHLGDAHFLAFSNE